MHDTILVDSELKVYHQNIAENSVSVFEVQLSRAFFLAIKHTASLHRACLSLSIVVCSEVKFPAFGKYIIQHRKHQTQVRIIVRVYLTTERLTSVQARSSY